MGTLAPYLVCSHWRVDISHGSTLASTSKRTQSLQVHSDEDVKRVRRTRVGYLSCLPGLEGKRMGFMLMICYLIQFCKIE